MKVLIGLAMLTLAYAQSFESPEQPEQRNSWIELPYGNRDFNVKAKYGDNLELFCNDSRVDGLDYTVTKWILPDMSVMYPNDSDIYPSIDGTSGFTVTSDGLFMNITLVQPIHFGVYLCNTELPDGTEIIVKLGLNMWGPSYGDLWAKYGTAATWACSVTGAFIIAVAIASIIFVTTEEPEVFEDEEEEEERSLELNGLSKTYDNVGFENIDEDIQKATASADIETCYL